MKNKMDQMAQEIARALNNGVARSELKLFFRAALAKGMNTAELAKKMKVSTQTISLWKSGKSIPTAPHLKRLAEVVGVRADSLVDDFYPQK